LLYESTQSAQQPTRPQRRSDLNFPSIPTRPQQRSDLNLSSFPPEFTRYQSEIYGNRNIGRASGSSLRSTDHISTGSSRQPLYDSQNGKCRSKNCCATFSKESQ
jgi:hypothetical protein